MGGDSKKPGPRGSGAPTSHTLIVGDTLVSLAPDIEQTIEDALAGDERAWGRLYGQAGALIQARRPLPEPLASLLAARLAALSLALTARPLLDLRARLPNAVVPVPKMRAYGPKTGRRAALVEEAAKAAFDMLSVDNRRGRRTNVLKAVASITGTAVPELRTALQALEKAADQSG